MAKVKRVNLRHQRKNVDLANCVLKDVHHVLITWTFDVGTGNDVSDSVKLGFGS